MFCFTFRSGFCARPGWRALWMCGWLFVPIAQGQTVPSPQSSRSDPLRTSRPSHGVRQPGSTAAEARAAHAFEQARADGPLALHVFLEAMPKGADLHMHLSGAVYAETLLDEAAQDGMCVDPAALALDRTAPRGACRAGELSGAAALERDNHLRDALIDSFSMRGFVPSPGVSGHDQFFATFARFGGLGREHTGDWLDEVAIRAARQNEQYLEVMDTPDLKTAETLADQLGYNPNFRAARDALLGAGIDASVAEARVALNEAETRRRTREHCGEPGATPACGV